MRLDHVGALKRLSTEELDLEDSQQTVDLTGKDVGNCKAGVSDPRRPPTSQNGASSSLRQVSAAHEARAAVSEASRRSRDGSAEAAKFRSW
jgi:hypothetical protein